MQKYNDIIFFSLVAHVTAGEKGDCHQFALWCNDTSGHITVVTLTEETIKAQKHYPRRLSADSETAVAATVHQ